MPPRPQHKPQQKPGPEPNQEYAVPPELLIMLGEKELVIRNLSVQLQEAHARITALENPDKE